MSFEMDWKNGIVGNGTYYSRYIASWINSGGKIAGNRKQFESWLMSVGCTEEEAKDIFYMGTNGKLELEENARKFLKEN